MTDALDLVPGRRYINRIGTVVTVTTVQLGYGLIFYHHTDDPRKLTIPRNIRDFCKKFLPLTD
jgi:hypothetical protein